MRAVFLVLLFSSAAMADSAKSRLGGPNLDEELAHEWNTVIKDQGFPILPHASKMSKPPDDLKVRQRYIMYMGTGKLNPKIEKGDDGYYQMLYAAKETGNYLLIIHEKFKDCFVDAKKKFDEMQAVVYSNGSYDTEDGKGLQSVIVEKTRQCRGDFSGSGGKVKKGK